MDGMCKLADLRVTQFADFLCEDLLGSSWGQSGLQKVLAEAWEQRHSPLTIRSFPAKPPALLEPAVCCQMQWCICQEDSLTTAAHRFHGSFVRLLKPHVCAIRQKKQKDQPESEPKKKKKPQYPPQRLTLEEGLLVVNISPAEDLEMDRNSLFEASWASAASAESHPGDSNTHEASSESWSRSRRPVWLHLSYVNYQTYECSAMSLREGCRSLDKIELHVEEKPVVATLREFFLQLDLDIAWVASWYQILSDLDPVDMESLRANKVVVAPMPQPNIPAAIVWQGRAQELQARKEAAELREKRAKNASGKSRARKPTLAKTAAGLLEQTLGDADLPIEDGYALGYGFGDDSNQEEEEADEDAVGALLNDLQDRADLANLLMAGWPQELESDPKKKKAKKRAVDSDQPKQKQTDTVSAHEGSSSSSSKKKEDVPAEDAGNVSTRAGLEHGEEHEKQAAPSSSKEPAQEARPRDSAPISRPKLVTEDVLVLPGLGSIRYNSRTRVLVAHCDHANHGSHVCKRQRSALKATRTTFKSLGQGRPLGLLCAWLQDQENHLDQASHVGKMFFTFESRKGARDYLKTIDGADRFFNFERDQGDDPHSEPDDIS